MRGVIAAVMLLLAGCDGARDSAVDTAIRDMRAQVASSARLDVDPADARAHYQQDETVRYAVCGTATVDGRRQRFVSLVARSGAAITEFEGSPARPDFQRTWTTRCG